MAVAARVRDDSRWAESDGIVALAVRLCEHARNSTHLNGSTDTVAMKQVFGERAYSIPVSGTKAITATR
jgi:hypothetical protein